MQGTSNFLIFLFFHISTSQGILMNETSEINCIQYLSCTRIGVDLMKITSKFKCSCEQIQSDVCEDLEYFLVIKFSNRIVTKCSIEIKGTRLELNGSSLIIYSMLETDSSILNCNITVTPWSSNGLLRYQITRNLNYTNNCNNFDSLEFDESDFQFFIHILIAGLSFLSVFIFTCLCIYYGNKRKKLEMNEMRIRQNQNVVFKEPREIGEQFSVPMIVKAQPVLLSSMSMNKNDRRKASKYFHKESTCESSFVTTTDSSSCESSSGTSESSESSDFK